MVAKKTIFMKEELQILLVLFQRLRPLEQLICLEISLTVYQRPVDRTHKVIIRVLNGSTNINPIN